MKITIFTIAVILIAFVSTINAQQKEVKIYLQKDVDLLDITVRSDWVAVKRMGDVISHFVLHLNGCSNRSLRLKR